MRNSHGDPLRDNAAQVPTMTTIPVAYTIIVIVLVAIALRPGIVSTDPLLSSIIDEFQLSHSTASLLTTIPDLLMGLFALPTPWLARRFGRNPVLLLALLTLCIAIAARAFSTNVSMLLLTTAGVGTGIAIAGALIAGYIKENFPHKAAFVMGIYATALSFGSSISAASSGLIAGHSQYGWRVGSGVWSLFAAIGLIAWLFVAKAEQSRNLVKSRPARLPWRNRKAWLVALFFAANNFLFYAVLTWTAPMYIEYGLSTSTAGFILATFTTVFMLSNPILGAISKSLDRRRWLALCAAVAVLGLMLIATVPGWSPFLSISLCAFGLGGAFTLGMTLPLDNTHSVDEANAWNAFVLTVGYLVAAAGPLSVGFLRDITQEFHLSNWLLVLVATAMLAITPALKPLQHSDTEALL